MLSRRLEMFFEVAQKGSFSKAADTLYLSTVSVKKQIDSLETEVGVALFNRTNQGVQLTPAGEVFLIEARKIPKLAQRAIDKARIEGLHLRQTIRIGTSLIRPCTPLIDWWWNTAQEDNPFDLQIIPFEEDSIKLTDVHTTLSHDFDCFVAPCDSAYWRDACTILELCKIPLRLSMAKTHPLAQKDILAWSDLDGQTIMLPQSHDFSVIPSLQEEIHIRHPNIHIARTAAHTTAATFNQCVQEGLLMASYDIWDHVHPLLATKPVDWNWAVPYGMVYSSSPTPAMTAFASAVKHALHQNPFPVE